MAEKINNCKNDIPFLKKLVMFFYVNLSRLSLYFL